MFDIWGFLSATRVCDDTCIIFDIRVGRSWFSFVCSQRVCKILEGGRDIRQVPVFAGLVCAKYLECYHVMF